MKTAHKLLSASLLSLLAASACWGHPGHAVNGLNAGLLHPFSGLDHLLAMVAVGLWATQLKGSSLWTLPSLFVGGLCAGALAGTSGYVANGLELWVAGSVLLLGVFIALSLKVNKGLALGLVALLGAMHGLAHGAELPAEAGVPAYFTGFIVSTIVLHLAGVLVGTGALKEGRSAVLRSAGAGIALTGLVLLLA